MGSGKIHNFLSSEVPQACCAADMKQRFHPASHRFLWPIIACQIFLPTSLVQVDSTTYSKSAHIKCHQSDL